MEKFEPNGRVFCLGAINMDLVMEGLSAIPRPGETLRAPSFATYPGGKGANQAVASAAMGARAHMLGMLGSDAFSEQLLENLEKKGVDCQGVLRVEGSRSGIAMIVVDKQGQNAISFYPGATGEMTPEGIPECLEGFGPGGVLLLTLEPPLEVVMHVAKKAHESGMLVILDPAPATNRVLPTAFAKHVDLVKPNETEAFAMTGVEITDSNAAQLALNRLRVKGFSIPVITLGENGCTALLEGRVRHFDSPKVQAVDSTAAGDVFSGTLAARIALGDSLERAISLAAQAAALSTTRKGAQTSIPTLGEVQQHYPEG